MNKLYGITAGGSFLNDRPDWLVDGHTVKSDVFIDSDGDSDREWRTATLTTMRRGGRGVLALDITQPDAIGAAPDYKPFAAEFSTCRNNVDSNCDGNWPEILWEFTDETDADGNCQSGLSGDDCAPWWDLGWTWSRPAIARVPVYNSSDANAPDDVFIAFFGGGWDKRESDLTGTHIYGVDIATGAIVYKQSIGVSVPGSFAAHDSDLDGFHDRIYFGDSDGSMWRIEFPAPNDSAATGIGAANLERIFDFRAGFGARQQFFTRPIIVPASFDGANFVWALAMGARLGARWRNA